VQLLGQILEIVYQDKVREGEGATYGVQTNTDLYDFPKGRTSIRIMFDADPDKQEKAIEIVKSELEKIAEEGPREVHLNKCRTNILKGRMELVQENGYWLNMLNTYYYKGFDTHTEYDSTLNSITTDEIKTFTDELLKQGNLVEVVMLPE